MKYFFGDSIVFNIQKIQFSFSCKIIVFIYKLIDFELITSNLFTMQRIILILSGVCHSSIFLTSIADYLFRFLKSFFPQDREKNFFCSRRTLLQKYSIISANIFFALIIKILLNNALFHILKMNNIKFYFLNNLVQSL